MMDVDKAFAKLASHIAHAAGRPVTFILCIVLVLVWALSGPLFGFSETWQLVINTGTTIVTFLMVFLIQNTQNRDGMAVQAKLDDLILHSSAENEFVGIEKLTDKELAALRDRCAATAERHVRLAKRADDEIRQRDESKPKRASAPKRPPKARTRARPAPRSRRAQDA